MASHWLQCKYLALIHSKYNYHASWQSWLKRGPAHARIHWYDKGWRTSWDANNRGISPAFRHRWILEGLLWTGLLALGRGARPRENILGFLKQNLSLSRIWKMKCYYYESTLSACRRQSIRLILPFWSGFDNTHMAGFLPVMERTKSSRHSWAMSFRSFPRSREAHFCFTSTFSDWKYICI